MVPRCQDYLYNGEKCEDITIRPETFRLDNWNTTDENIAIYLESGFRFYVELLRHEGIMLHSSAVEFNGKAFLFSGNCGVGKSTHTRLWQSTFGVDAQVFNDDKPALRFQDGRWYAYGTPWCGKDGINRNRKVPLAGICFLKQAPKNTIRRLSLQEASMNIISQTLFRFYNAENLKRMISHVDKLVRTIPVFELENRPESEAARLSYETMRCAAEELGL